LPLELISLEARVWWFWF